MKIVVRLGLIVGLVGGISSSVLAQEVTCEAGQRKTAFADGNTVTEVCVDASAMDQTVVNSEVPVGEDSSNTDGHTES